MIHSRLGVVFGHCHCTVVMASSSSLCTVVMATSPTGVAAAKDHDIGTTNLHIEASDVVNVLVYVGIAKGNGVLSKAGKEPYRAATGAVGVQAGTGDGRGF